MLVASVFLALIALILPSSVFAQQSGSSAMPVYETVIRDIRGIWSFQSKQNQTVIVEKENSVTEVMHKLPGAVTTESVGNSSSIFLWGADSAKSLVLLDGIPIADGSSPSGAYDFDLVPASSIEKIRWLSPAEAVPWGSGALGGIIWLSTGRNSRAGLALSSDQSKSGFLAVNSGDQWKTHLWSSVQNNSGYSSAKESRGNSEKDDSSKFSFGITSKLESENSIWQLHLSHLQKNEKYDGFDTVLLVPKDDPNAVSGHQQWQTSVSNVRYFSDDWETRFQIVLKRIARQNSDSQDTISTNYLFANYDNDLLMMRSQNLVKINSAWTLDFGADLQTETVKINSIDNFANEIVNQTEGRQGLFARALIHFKQLRLIPGFRQEWQGPRLESISAIQIEKDLNENATLEVSSTQGVRSPSMYQLYSSLYGNSNLKSERVHFLLLSYVHKTEMGNWRFDFFDQDYLNLITTDAALKFQNIEQARIRGWDLGISQQIGKNHLQVSLTEYDTKDGQGKPLARRPRYQLSGQWKYAVNDQWSFHVDGIFKSERSDGIHWLNPFQLWQSGVAFESGKYEWQVIFKNIFDLEYEEIFGYQTPGRSIYSSLQYRF